MIGFETALNVTKENGSSLSECINSSRNIIYGTLDINHFITGLSLDISHYNTVLSLDNSQ